MRTTQSLCVIGLLWSACSDYKIAKQELSNVEKSIGQTNALFTNLEERYERTKIIHKPKYLEYFDLSSARQNLLSAYAELNRAKNSDKVYNTRRLARLAMEYRNKASQDIRKQITYLDLLDQARDEYVKKVQELKDKISAVHLRHDELVELGYFIRLFDESYTVVSEAEKILAGLTISSAENDDYLQIWKDANIGLERTVVALNLANEIPEIREKTPERVQSLKNRITKANALYSSAVAAAKTLEKYPKYACLKQVYDAVEPLDGLQNRLEFALKQIDFKIQKFIAAKDILDKTEKDVSTAEKLFSSTITNGRNVAAALQDFGLVDSNAAYAIQQANDHISMNSQNYQNRAKELYDNAQRARENALRESASDPVEARRLLEQAVVYAHESYNAVDTSDDALTTIIIVNTFNN